MDDDSQQRAELAFIDTLYGDPVRDSTIKASRNLLVASLLLIAVMKFGAQVQSTSLFPVVFKEPDVLPTLLAVLVGLLLTNFFGRVLMDIGLFFEGERRIERFIGKAQIDAAVKSAREIDDSIDTDSDEGHPDPDPWWEEVGKIRAAAQAAEGSIEKRLGRRTGVRIVRNIRAAGEVLVPLAFAIVALWLSAPSWRWPA
ncbi:hypothetical protein [uncultured Brevundimonas sp.]|uniref:hypothetical protein n=1 Tax=uncultured Brevundimonas sp. TaxID=213418 RepID=UPI0025D2849C|nr:hypothetical protein [uncultured Brevundimonas sp.]